MADWMFIDRATITVTSGRGGDGSVSFRREKYVPKGGPDGGNGGNGGSVVIRAEHQLSTLLDFRYKKYYKAESGEPGKGARKTGKSGEDTMLSVPCGTIVRDGNTEEVLADLVDDGDEVVAARGGKGGRGNSQFATPTDQAPRRAERGTPGEERTLLLELKLLADVGIVGFPNAGKSTLISRISAAKPKIADYPFTTLVPNLGIVRYREYQSFVVADMPGLIKGAHEGKGLGIQFLRHIERTRVLLYLVDCTSQDPKNDYKTLSNELAMYEPGLVKKPHLVAFSKMDLANGGLKKDLTKLTFGRGKKPLLFSSVDGVGLKELVEALWKALAKAPR